MTRVSSGTISPANLSGAFVTAATVAAPGSGAYEYRVVLLVSGLASGHQVQVRETVAGSNVDHGERFASGSTVELIETSLPIAAGDGNYVVSLRDTAGLSSTAVIGWEVWRVEDGAGGGGTPPDVEVEITEVRAQ